MSVISERELHELRQRIDADALDNLDLFEAMSPYERSEWHKGRAVTPARWRIRTYLEARVSQMRAERVS